MYIHVHVLHACTLHMCTHEHVIKFVCTCTMYNVHTHVHCSKDMMVIHVHVHVHGLDAHMIDWMAAGSLSAWIHLLH